MIRAVVKAREKYENDRCLVFGTSWTTRLSRRRLARFVGPRPAVVERVLEGYVDFEQPFSRTPDIDSYGQGEQCLILTVMSDKDWSLEVFRRPS